MGARKAKQEGATEGAARKRGGKLKLIALPAVLLLLGGGLWFTGVLPRLLAMVHPAHAATGAAADGKAAKPGAAAGAKPPAHPPIYVELPETIANLDAPPRRPVYVKLAARLEVERPEDQALVMQAMPRIQDLFSTYLREMRPEELRGSVGTYRLREELIARASIAAAPARIVDVLFTEMIVQ
jgi:flagellar FliL protein